MPCIAGSGHEVALKLLRSAHPDDAHRFRREAQLLALLDHPCIPRFYDYVQVAETPYISMARAPGVPAVKFCRLTDANRLSFAEVAHVGLQLAGVLAHVHARGILHRDVNANNVLIDLQRSPRVTLLDFGNAALTEQFLQRRRGPPISDPARVARGHPRRGHRDAALGGPRGSRQAGLHRQERRVLAGPAAVSPGHRDDADDQGSGRASVPRVYARACPEDLAFAILSALNPDPKERPGAAELAARLEDVLAEDEDASLPVTPPRVAGCVGPARTAACTRAARGDHERLDEVHGGHRGARQRRARTVQRGPHPKGRRRVLPFHPRDILERATTLEPDFAPAALPAAHAPWRARAAGAAVLLLSAAVFLVWATGRSGNQSATGATASTWASQAPAPSQLPEPTAAAPSTPPSAPRTETSAPLPAMLDALKQVSGPLFDCARLAGGVLIVEFKTAEHRERFAGTRVVGEELPAVIRCVDEAVAPVRFAPAPVQTHTEEYIL
jgi:hypothetical protein